MTEKELVDLVLQLTSQELEEYRPVPEAALALRSGKLVEGVLWRTGVHLATRYLLPSPLRLAWTLFRAAGFMRAAVSSLANRRLDVPVLDAAAVLSCLLKNDYTAASSAMFLVNMAEFLEDQTRRYSEQALIASLLDLPERVGLIDAEGEERAALCTEIREGDTVVVRTGAALPVDGEVVRGQAWVNQSTLTGESAAVMREVGDDVFAGTAIEEGELYVRVKAAPEHTRLRSVVALVQQSEALKATSQERMERLANGIVPYNLLYAGLVFAFTRSLEKMSAALMVDYSCALKLTGSIAALSACAEAARYGIQVKGSRVFEAIAQADTIVFDKTGTLTNAAPEVAAVVPFEGWEEVEVVRLAACLEEHFPHPVARAVVAYAAKRGIDHRERHAEVEYIVAHGIVSTLDCQRTIIGSGHFVFDDEGIPCDQAVLETLYAGNPGSSPLFLAVDGRLVGTILIRDPLRGEVAEALDDLRKVGFSHVVMLTGDNFRTAQLVAEEAGIKEFKADLLPEDKHAFIKALREQGARVVMVGDGVNDSPALSCADVGIAMGEGAAIAREVADVTLLGNSLRDIVALRRLSVGFMKRMEGSYRGSIALNTALLLSGTAGLLAPSTSSLVHNSATVALSVNGMRRYLPDPAKPA
jgi:heavy metal translocating P-type ATPase